MFNFSSDKEPPKETAASESWFGGSSSRKESEKGLFSSFLGGDEESQGKNDNMGIFGPKKAPPSTIDKGLQAVGLQEKEPTVYDTLCDSLGCDKIPWKYRIGGWLVCLLIAFCLSIGTLALIVSVLEGRPEEFVIPFTFAHLIALGGSMLLSTPKKFCRIAFDKYHWGATSFYLLSIFFTLFVVFYEDIDTGARIGVIVMMMFVQYLSYIWFCISQIPFMARIQKDYCRRFCGCDKCPGFFE